MFGFCFQLLTVNFVSDSFLSNSSVLKQEREQTIFLCEMTENIFDELVHLHAVSSRNIPVHQIFAVEIDQALCNLESKLYQLPHAELLSHS